MTRIEFDQLVMDGVFEDERVELVRGEVVEMAPIGPDHCDGVEVLTEMLVWALKDRARVRVQLSFAASDDSEPQPDVLIVDRRVPRGSHQHPDTALLAIEVAESSLKYDRTVKAELYAEAGIPEYWVVNVSRGVLEVFTRLRDGRYEDVRTHARDETIHLTAFPDVAVRVADLFPWL
jgi:Uma2 family endonuclease